MDVETQHSDWWSAHEQLMGEITGARPHRWPRSFVAVGVLLLLLFAATTAWGFLSEDYLRSWDQDQGLLPSVLAGASIAFVLAGAAVHARGGSAEAPQPPVRGLHWDQRHRMVRLLSTADRRDPHQLAWAAALARQIEAEAFQLLVFAGLVLMMLSQLLGADTVSALLLSGGGFAVGAVAFLLLAVQDNQARAFLRRTAPWRQPVA